MVHCMVDIEVVKGVYKYTLYYGLVYSDRIDIQFGFRAH